VRSPRGSNCEAMTRFRTKRRYGGLYDGQLAGKTNRSRLRDL
jgi:hypothetical protein